MNCAAVGETRRTELDTRVDLDLESELEALWNARPPLEHEVKDDPCTFTATTSLRDWHRIIGYADDPGFRAEARLWFAKVGVLLQPLLALAT
jgi:hypothetical protein